HNVFSISKTTPFNIGRYGKGPGKTITFNKVGCIRVFCDIHSFMNANLLVLPSPHFMLCDASGHFKLEGVPTGSYYVVAWHPRLKSQQVPVTVTGGKTSTADITVR